MAGLPWIKLHTDLLTHRKAIQLRVELQTEWAWAHVVRLWMWAAAHLGDGVIEGAGVEVVIEDAAGWKGKSGDFVRACVRCGFLDEASSGYRIHNWDHHAGAHVERRRKDVERKRRSRTRPAEVQRTRADPDGKPREKKRPSLSPSPSPCLSPSLASDETRTETVLTGAVHMPATPLNGNSFALDAEAQALLRLLPAKAVDVALALHLPAAAVDMALEELRGRGLVRLGGGMVPLWEIAS